MKVKCIDCLNFTLRENQKLAKFGFGICLKNTESTVYISPICEHECDIFEQLEKSKVDERVKFLEKLNGRKS